MRRPRRFPLWSILGLVLVVALLASSGLFRSSPPTDAQRAQSIESNIRCPSCEDLSVADSTAPTAAAVRATVRQQVADGRTDRQIEDYLSSVYGSAIVLDPPASGWTLLVWVLPVAAVVGAVLVGGALLVRRRSAERAEDTADPATGDDPAVLEERRRFLSRSLADADAEYLAGDLSDADYLSLRQRDLRRLSSVSARLGAPGAAAVDTAPVGVDAAPVGVDTAPVGADTAPVGEDAAPGSVAGTTDPATATATAPVQALATTGTAPGAGDPRPVPTPSAPGKKRTRRTWYLTVAVTCFCLALVLGVFLSLSNRQPGQSVTGTVDMTAAQRIQASLDQAATLENQGQSGEAAQRYQSVLDDHPDNEVALAQLGWLEFETSRSGDSTSLLADARTKLARAAALDPGDYAVHLYLGTVAFVQDGDAPAAVAEYGRFLADDPPSSVLAQAASEMRKAYAAAGVAVPAGVPGG